jgi:carbon monoxide dehydrogenase subunit G
VAPIMSTVEIARPAQEVFSYVTDPSRFGEWQEGVVSAGVEGGGPQAVGSHCTTTRLIGGRKRTSTQEITVLDPPRRWSVHGIDGPVRADVDVVVEALGEGSGSRVTIALDFRGHGIGRVIVPLFVRRQAASEVPRSCAKLKQRLERN